MRFYSVEPDPFPPAQPNAARAEPALRIVAAARTDRGRERADNQDRALLADASTDAVWEPPSNVMLEAAHATSSFYALVCDGMGGEAGGALASGLAVETTAGAMRSCFTRLAALPPGSPAVLEARVARCLVASLEAASARIKQAARDEPVYARMGTTATLAVVAGNTLLCAQVGDSRAYVLRRGLLAQVTRDQTMVEYLRSTGAVPLDQIPNIVGSNVILQALGSSTKLEVPITRTPLEDGDVVLLCSDGLHGPVEAEEIASLLGTSSGPAAACDALVDAANANGGPDNISVVVFVVTTNAKSADDGAPPVATAFDLG